MKRYKILFLCHGNICRSPMAEFIMKDLVKKRNLQDRFIIDSAAVTTEEIGNGIYPPAKRKLYEKGIPFDDHRARLITKKEVEENDMVFVMDNFFFLKIFLSFLVPLATLNIMSNSVVIKSRILSKSFFIAFHRHLLIHH